MTFTTPSYIAGLSAKLNIGGLIEKPDSSSAGARTSSTAAKFWRRFQAMSSSSPQRSDIADGFAADFCPNVGRRIYLSRGISFTKHKPEGLPWQASHDTLNPRTQYIEINPLLIHLIFLIVERCVSGKVLRMIRFLNDLAFLAH